MKKKQTVIAVGFRSVTSPDCCVASPGFVPVRDRAVGYRIQGLQLRVSSSRCRAWGLGCGV